MTIAVIAMTRELSQTPGAVFARNRRIRNADNGRCINENKAGTHGPPKPGYVRCPSCIETHARSRSRDEQTDKKTVRDGRGRHITRSSEGATDLDELGVTGEHIHEQACDGSEQRNDGNQHA